MTVGSRGRRNGLAGNRRSAFNKANDKMKPIPLTRVPIPIVRESRLPKIQMVSSLGDSNLDNRSNWPETSIYQPIGNNVAGEGLSERLKEAIHEGLKKKNQICCSCGPGVNCALNPDCECRKVGKNMAEQFSDKRLLKFGDTDPIELNQQSELIHQTFFNCSNDCSCKGKCQLNSLQAVKEQNFLIKRTDGRGFCLYSKVGFKKGEAVVPFNGVLVGYWEICKNEDIEKYALQVIGDDMALGKWFGRSTFLDANYMQLLKKAFSRNVHINPLEKGNCSRFLSHSCRPNLALRRVFQGGVSPINARIVMFALRDIAPDEELTFYYGDVYKKKFLGNCLCTSCKEQRQLRKARSSVSEESEGNRSTASSSNVDHAPSSVARTRFNLNRVKREPESQERDISEPEATPEPQIPRSGLRVHIKQEFISDDESDEEIDYDDPEYVVGPNVQRLTQTSSSRRVSARISQAAVVNQHIVRRVQIKEEKTEAIEVSPRRGRGRPRNCDKPVPKLQKTVKQEPMDHSPSPLARSPSSHGMNLRASIARETIRRQSVAATSHSIRLPSEPGLVRQSSRVRAVSRIQQSEAREEEPTCRRPVARVQRYSPISTPPVRRSVRQTEISQLQSQTHSRSGRLLRSTSRLAQAH